MGRDIDPEAMRRDALKAFGGNYTANAALFASRILTLLDDRKRLEAENAALRESLRPFSTFGAAQPQGWPDGYNLVIDPRLMHNPNYPTLGDCRRARAALEGQADG